MAEQASHEGQVVLVTGGTAGIGEATARAFAAAGAHVVVAGRNRDRGTRVVDAIRADGGESIYVQADVAEPAQVEQLVRDTVELYGGLDHAFNNAGIFDRGATFDTYTTEAWDEMIAVNLSGVFHAMKYELAAMLELGTGPGGGRCIVNNASTVAHRGSGRASPAYVAAKHGVLGLTRQAAVEYAGRGIRVNAVSPGPTLTEISAPLVAEGPDAVAAALGDLNPLARFIEVDEVAAAVLYLCSPAAAAVNGHDIPLDGGQLAGL